MPTVTEKGIRLDFPADWAVVKYDGDVQSVNAGFYRTYIESKVQNVRGVDVVVLALGPGKRLLLIEVKDYRVSVRTAEQDLAKLRQTVVQKALNTLSGLYAAARVGDLELGAVAASVFQPSLRIEVILFLERPPLPFAPATTAAKLRRQNPQTAIDDLRLQLNSRLNALGMVFEFRSSNAMKSADEWSVRA